MSQNQRTPGISRHLVAFCDALRDGGVSVSTAEVTAGARALAVGDPLDRDDVYQSLKATIITNPADVEAFDAVFETWWAQAGPDREPADETPEIDESGPTTPQRRADDVAAPLSEPGPDRGPPIDRSTQPGTREKPAATAPSGQRQDTGDRPTGAAAVARAEEANEGVERVRFDNPTIHGEASAVSLLVGELRSALGTLTGPSRQRETTGQLDLRAALDQSRVPDPASLPRLEQRRTATRLRLFVDVSRSMVHNVDRAFLVHVLFECVEQFGDCRVYFFDTDVTEVTAHFQTVDPRQAVKAMERAHTEWGSGTTIGRCLAQLLTGDPFVVDNRTVTVIVSDGWDAGDLDLLETQLRVIARRGTLLLWLNPLATYSTYKPRVGGMETAMPFLDHFWGFSDLDDLRAVVRDLRQSPRR